ncbi:Uncharacterised protein [Mycobacteroides abscessus subsp. abscessus]|nr:Uncharacterised protein [Mycobacteroides abscessus subsp. abscessus]
MPASVSASSYTSDCALMRYNTATSEAGVPDSISAAMDFATDLASAASSSCSENLGAGPCGR